MTREILLQTRGLGRRFAERRAVRDVNLEVQRGEVHGLLGLNGAGKTTTLRMLCGTLAPTEGDVRLAGIDLLERPIAARRQLGYLPEVPPLHLDTTVEEYLRYAALLRRVPRRRCKAAVTGALQRCDLEAVAHRLIRNLSKGFRQRVGIAQAIIHEPAVIVLDEPTAGLDPRQVNAVRGLIGELRRDHAVIFSSHILPEVQSLCDRVTILHQGRQVFQGRPGGDSSSHRVRLRFRVQPPLAMVAAVSGLEAVESTDDPHAVIVMPVLDSALDALVKLSVDQGWGLQELSPVRPTLEQIFLELTAGREAA
ncbi:MAG: ABC transporter ATP-binding protein [Ectothiorhodospiraceae bacterium]|nr:ABC transporter ATP-binding protein [Ectothiorhodospiraceae bacterium]